MLKRYKRAHVLASLDQHQAALQELELLQNQAPREASVSSHPLTLSPSHPLTLSPSHPLTLSPSHPLTLSPSHPITLSSSHPLILSSSHPLILSSSHPLTLSPSRSSPSSLCYYLAFKVSSSPLYNLLIVFDVT